MKKGTLLYLAQAGMIAAIYAALTYLAMALNLAYGSIQFRFSEALTILPIFTPAAVPGLAIGCLIGNLASPYPLGSGFRHGRLPDRRAAHAGGAQGAD